MAALVLFWLTVLHCEHSPANLECDNNQERFNDGILLRRSQTSY